MNRKLIRPFSTAFDLFKTHLPQSVSKDIYNKEIEDYKSYNYTEKDITNLNLFLETLTHQSELLQRYQIGVQRDETRKNKKIAELCGLKIPDIKFREPEPVKKQ